jgi:hypothetical protein
LSGVVGIINIGDADFSDALFIQNVIEGKELRIEDALNGVDSLGRYWLYNLRYRIRYQLLVKALG